jgi:hypothetical protein
MYELKKSGDQDLQFFTVGLDLKDLLKRHHRHHSQRTRLIATYLP